MSRAVKMESNVVYVEMPGGVSYHHLLSADGVLLIRRLILTKKLKEDYDSLSQYLVLLGLVESDRYVVVFDEDGQAYDIFDPETDQVHLRIVPAIQGPGRIV